MGTMSNSLKQEYVKKYGEEKWHQHVHGINEMWDGLKSRINSLKLDWTKVRVYQDGLPVCGKEKEIIEDLAAKKSKNHELVQWLVKMGAKIEGTEDAAFLLEEYKHVKKIAVARTNEERNQAVKDYEAIAVDVLIKRDEFIRKRIEETLKDGETGILFMGLLHKVDEDLAEDIRVSYLIHRLPFKRRFDINKI
ncbi:MAG: hypothetical protein KKD69_04180 [Euryarchaeota archaeon]|nr:hypothetical protein [Euryarchaeota archaeon]